jgi:UDP-N-acetyl-L-fucosamine synthase
VTAAAASSPLKVLTVLGTRPEIIRLSRVIALLDAQLAHVLVHTGQNYDYELNRIFFEDLGLRMPDHFLEAAGGGAAQTIGTIIARADAVMEAERPDACLVLGDTNSCLAVIAAKRRKIPIFHMEAGNRCFDQRVPEETNRRIVDHVSDVNMPYSAIAREYLLREGIPPELVVRTGSPMKEVLSHYQQRIGASTVLGDLGLDEGRYLVLSSHREENVDDDARLRDLVDAMNALAARYAVPLIVSTHPRTRKRFEARDVRFDPLVRLLKPLRFTDYVRLQRSALATLSDSGTITEESSILGFPAVNLREAHERPEGMEEGAVPMAGLRPESVLRCAQMVIERRRAGRPVRVVADYDVSNVSEKVLAIILSYTDYVNRRIWQKR